MSSYLVKFLSLSYIDQSLIQEILSIFGRKKIRGSFVAIFGVKILKN